MKFWSAQSIAGRLTALILFVSGTALLLAYVSLLPYDFYTLRHNLIESLETQATIIGRNSETALLFDAGRPQKPRSQACVVRDSS